MIKNYKVLEILSFDEAKKEVSVLVRDQILLNSKPKEISFTIKKIKDLSSQQRISFFDWLKKELEDSGFCWIRGFIPSSRRTVEGFLYERKDCLGSFGNLVEHE